MSQVDELVQWSCWRLIFILDALPLKSSWAIQRVGQFWRAQTTVLTWDLASGDTRDLILISLWLFLWLRILHWPMLYLLLLHLQPVTFRFAMIRMNFKLFCSVRDFLESQYLLFKLKGKSVRNIVVGGENVLYLYVVWWGSVSNGLSNDASCGLSLCNQFLRVKFSYTGLTNSWLVDETTRSA